MSENVNKTIHLGEDDLELLSGSCVLCQYPTRIPAGPLQEAPPVQLLRCENCCVVSASRLPKEEILTRFYQQYYQGVSFQGRREKVAVVSPRRLAEHIHRSVGNYLPEKEINILDFGGGDGSVALWIAKRLIDEAGVKSVRILVIDFDIESVAVTETGGITIQKQRDLDEASSGAYDLVLASAILEHLIDPRPVLEKLLKSLKPHGVFYARTPYIVPLRQVIHYFGLTFDFTYPAHLHDMGAAFWGRILAILRLDGSFGLVSSRPSFVETLFSSHFFRTTAAYLLKSPSYILGRFWPYVGGWEVVIRRQNFNTVRKD